MQHGHPKCFTPKYPIEESDFSVKEGYEMSGFGRRKSYGKGQQLYRQEETLCAMRLHTLRALSLPKPGKRRKAVVVIENSIVPFQSFPVSMSSSFSDLVDDEPPFSPSNDINLIDLAHCDVFFGPDSMMADDTHSSSWRLSR
ncbi:hypothetical protein GCK32_007945 [Trichostrongylus colubriformis]|uniref:Uncharacterized protein n=1 Tax=Trichostrongylus colubriformis TaxID=6319 RepID=A0AAN8GDZ6_TRICO